MGTVQRRAGERAQICSVRAKLEDVIPTKIGNVDIPGTVDSESVGGVKNAIGKDRSCAIRGELLHRACPRRPTIGVGQEKFSRGVKKQINWMRYAIRRISEYGAEAIRRELLDRGVSRVGDKDVPV